jgi:DNA-binding LacI/PurR family transcriptional regulator
VTVIDMSKQTSADGQTVAAGPPTLVDVAKAAGVSTATASRVLNGFSRVRPETRRQVETAMATLGYVRQRAGRLSRPRRAGSIAFIVCEEGPRLFSDPFFAGVLWGASQELDPVGVQLVLLVVRSTTDYQAAALRYLRQGNVDGALFVSMHGRRPIDLSKIDVPVVMAGRPPVWGEVNRASYVDADNRGGAARAVRYLIESGRMNIATVAGPGDMAPGVDRLDGYRTALAEAGRFDPGLVVYGDFGQVSADHAIHRLLDLRPNVDAIFAASDLMALGALRALRRTGRRVPDDVALIGFDDLPIARHADPPLTTVRQPVEEMGTRMARELLALIRGTSTAPSCLVLDTELVVRVSA